MNHAHPDTHNHSPDPHATDEPLVYIGRRAIWGGERLFGLGRLDRRQHLYLIGQTGTGKSTLLRNLILQDVYAGEGVTVIDPHGDLAEEVLDHVPRRRVDDVVYLNPADYDFPVALNLLRPTASEDRHLVASGVVSCFKSIWRDSWGPRLEFVLYAAVAALLECRNISLLGVQRMLTDPRYRAWVVKQVADPAVRDFWAVEFEHYDRRFLSEVISPIQNKVGQLLMAPLVRNIFGQVKSKIDLRHVIDRRQILVANLAKGRIGPDKANLVGAVLVNELQQAAMSRASIPEHERVDHFAYVDEFHSFVTDSFAAVLSESRKYRLSLTVAHQFLAQAREEVRDAVFGNVGSVVSFRVGEKDAQTLARHIGGDYPPHRLSRLRNHEVCCRLLDGGEQAEPFLGTTLPPLFDRQGRRDRIVRRSRQRFATPRATVEDRIDRWMRRR